MKRMNSRLPALIGLGLMMLTLSGPQAAYRAFRNPGAELREFTPSFPPMQLIDQDGRPVSVEQLLARERNLVFAFFFTQCITICTTTTFTLKGVAPYLPDNTDLALISIDPDNDTPAALKRYAATHKLDSPAWRLLTGDKADIERFQRLLASYRGNKMNHNTAIFVKKSGCRSIIEVSSHFSIIPQLFKAGSESESCK